MRRYYDCLPYNELTAQAREKYMEQNRQDAEQIENFKAWWREQGLAVVGGIVVGLCALFGWRGWQAHLITQSQEASDIYLQLSEDDEDAGNPPNLKEIGERLIEDYDTTPYAEFAALLLAKEAVEENDLDAAGKHLRQVMEHGKNDELQHIVRTRLARLLLLQDKVAEASSLIDIAEAGEFTALYAEIRGDILLQQGDPEGAGKAYQEALDKSASAQSVLQTKLDDLGTESL